MNPKEIEAGLIKAADGVKSLNTDNHDEVRIAVGLLTAQSSREMTEAMHRLSYNLAGVGGDMIKAMKDDVERTIASNEKLAASNDATAKSNLRLAKVLISVTVVIGLLQVLAGSLQAFAAWQANKNMCNNSIGSVPTSVYPENHQ